MTNEMVLDHAILGLLQHRSLTGYELKKAFDSSIRHFWTADQSHIYRVLRRLAGEGHVVFEAVPQAAKPNRKVYTITAEGRRELRRWLQSEESREAPARDRYLVHLFFSGLLADEAILEIIRGDLERSSAFLAEYEALSDRILKVASENPSRERFFSYLTLDYALWMRRAFNEWLSTVIARIEQGEPDNPGWAAKFEESAGSRAAGRTRRHSRRSRKGSTTWGIAQASRRRRSTDAAFSDRGRCRRVRPGAIGHAILSDRIQDRSAVASAADCPPDERLLGPGERNGVDRRRKSDSREISLTAIVTVLQ